MTYPGYIRIDINILSLLLMIAITSVIYKREKFLSRTSKVFIAMSLSVGSILVLDSLARLLDGRPGPINRYALYTINYIDIFLNSIPPILWLYYIDLLLTSLEPQRRRKLYVIPVILSALILVISLFTHTVFVLDASNRYQRGWGMAVLFALQFLVFCSVLTLVVRKRASTSKDQLRVIVLFQFLPLAGMVLQMLFPGIDAIWPLAAFAILIAYLHIEIQNEVRDYLTGLLTRQQIETWIRFRMQRAAHKGPFTIVVIDLNDSKNINDSYGHTEGDRALVRMAYAMMRSVKRVDKAARFGGDEFILVLNSGDPKIAEAVLGRIRGRLDQERLALSFPYTIQFSAGYAVYAKGCHISYETLFHKADEMMYAAKAEMKRRTIV